MKRTLRLLALCMLAGCAPGPRQIKHLGQLSQAARAACAQPGTCPASVACIRAVIDATSPGNVNAKSYKTATSACDSFPVSP